MDIYEQIRKLVNSRPGFDSGNYDTSASYSADMRTAMKDRETALALLEHWFFRAYVKPETLGRYLEQSSGRLTLKDGQIEYIAGQYYPTEYRRAVVCALASCLWRALQEEYMAARMGDCSGAANAVAKQMKTALPPWLYRRIK